MAATVNWRPRPTDVLLLSGGIDSVAAWVMLGFPPSMHFRFASPYAAEEENRYWDVLNAARHQGYSAPPRIVTAFASLLGPSSTEGKGIEVPMRNLHMVNVAWSLGYDRVVLAAAGDWAPDKRWLFGKTAALAAKVALGRPEGRRLEVAMPFARWSKSQLLRAAVAKEGTWWLPLLYSCYHGTPNPCGECHACHRAAVAFAAARIAPPHNGWRVPPAYTWTFKTFLRWAVGKAPQWWAPGSLLLAWGRWQELRAAWQTVQHGAGVRMR